MEDHEFRSELNRLRSEAAELAVAEFQGLMLKAAQVLADAMEHSRPRVRLRASHIAISMGLKADELKDMNERIGRVDDALRLLARRHPVP